MRVAVVDDEALARRRLIRMLERIPDVAVVAEAGDGDAALAHPELAGADLLFLDVRMPGLDGLTIARRHGHALPPVVFVTAYSEHAVEAFAVDAVDYLLKPVNPERLAAAVARARRAAAADPAWRAAERLAATDQSWRVVVSSRGVARIFDARELTRLWSQDKYTVFRADGAEHLTEEPLASLEARLAHHGFARVHRAELVNLRRVRAMRTDDGVVMLELADGQRAPVSRRALAQVRLALGL